jgi:surface protein
MPPRIVRPPCGTRQYASAFNQPLSLDTSKVTNMGHLFQVRSARAATLTRIQPARCLITARPTRVPSPGPQSPPPPPDTRQSASYFNQPLSLDTSSVTDMSWLFYNLNNFNANISSWDTSKVATMRSMFWVRSARALAPKP